MDTTPAAGRIFVSYRRDDSAYATGWLTDRLAERYGAEQVFTDVDSIEIGDDFVRKITDAVASCDVLLAVIGQRWLTVNDDEGRRRLDDSQDYVRIEIEAALRRNVLVIPILVDGATMPRVTDLPGQPTVPGAEPDPKSLAALPRREALSLNPNQFDWAVDRLLGKLDKVLPRDGGPSQRENKRHKGNTGVPVTASPSAAMFDKRLRWTVVGLLVAAIAMMLLIAPLVLPAVTSARSGQPQVMAWMWLIWMAPAIPAAVALGLLMESRLTRLGTMLGCVVVAAWLVAGSWALLASRTDTAYGGIHAVLALLLLSAAGCIATVSPVRERVGWNPPARAALAVCLAVLGLFLRTQGGAIGDAIQQGTGAGVEWGLRTDRQTFWIGQILPVAVCVIAAVIHGNPIQTRALRTFVGVVVLYDIAIRGSTVAHQLATGPMDLGDLVDASLYVLGSLFVWWAARTGQPKRYERPRESSGSPIGTHFR